MDDRLKDKDDLLKARDDLMKAKDNEKDKRLRRLEAQASHTLEEWGEERSLFRANFSMPMFLSRNSHSSPGLE